MRIPRTEEVDESGIPLTSLMDLMFILLIFYVATTTFKEDERDIEVNLPSTSAQETMSSDPKVLVVNVRKPQDGQTDYYTVGQERMDVHRLLAIVTKELKADPDKKILIRGDQRAFHGQVAAAVDVCKNAGAKDAKIGYDVISIDAKKQ